MSEAAGALRAAAALVEAGDRDRFAATMALDPATRDRLWPLYAVNLEIARAPWASSEPVVAEMRLQWWIDALEALRDDGRAPQHEIGPALLALRDQAGLLAAAAEARRWDCWREAFEDREAFDAYLDATAGNLVWAAARALGAPAELEARLRDAAWAAGLAAYLVAVPALAARGRVPLVDGRPAAVAALAEEGRARLARARAGGRWPAAARAALLPGWQAEGVLERAARDPGRVVEGRLAPSEFARRAGLLRQVFTGR